MHIFLHILKCLVEAGALLCWVLTALAIVIAITSRNDPDTLSRGIGEGYGIIGGVILFLIGLAFFALWLLLVRGAHLPWWL